MRIFIYLTFLSVCTFVAPAHARDKTDIIWLANGDRFTGEIKQLLHGKLQLKTDSAGTLSIEWDDIARIESNFQFQFERTDGTRITGRIGESTDEPALAEGDLPDWLAVRAQCARVFRR